MNPMADGGEIAVLDIEEIPDQEEPITVLVPTVDETAGLVTGVVEMGSDAQLMRSYDLIMEGVDTTAVEPGGDDKRGGMVHMPPVGSRQLPSSLIRGPDTWHVTEISEETGGAARVSFGRRGHRELQMTLPDEARAHLSLGQPVLGTEALRARGSGIFGLGKARVEFVPDPDPPEPVPISIPVMRLHRPRRLGCEATHTVEREVGESAEMNVTVLGSGGNGGYRVRARMKGSYTARSACVETVIPAKLLLVPTKTVVNGTEVAYGLHAKLIDVDGDHQDHRPIPQELDECERREADLAGTDTELFPFRNSPEGDSGNAVIEVERETYGRLSVGLNIGGTVPVRFGLDYERNTAHMAALDVKFAAGADYLAYGPLRRPGATLGEQLEVCWATRG
jgi:hypothetical protein